jgi:hypothetical protein
VFDDQSVAGHTQDDRLAGVEQHVHATKESFRRILQMWVARRIHRSFVEDDGEFHEKVAQLAG